MLGNALLIFLLFLCLSSAHAINLNDGPSNLLQPNTSITNWPPSVATTKALYSSTKMAPARNSFPPIGSIERKYSPVDLDKLWRVVGPVVPPPFTTTPVPVVPFPLPTPPPPLYPAWFSPRPRSILPHLKLPEGFIFGIATAAYQVEGAAKDEGKGPSVWDWATHQSGFVIDNTTGDTTALHYFLYKEDIARVASLGVNAYSFSISWPRIFPFGTAESPMNQAGLDHYSELIDYSLELNVEPVITLFHWDMPLALQAYYGGIMSGEIIDDFVNYATTIFKAYNGRVKTWYTFNEPDVFCGHWVTALNVPFPVGVNSSNAPYRCAYNLLRAHAGAVKVFREMNITGEIAFKNDNYVGTPWRANSTEDAEAVERHAAFQIGLFSDPVYKGDWPAIVMNTLPEDYLPRFTEKEKREILGSADFYAITSYCSQYITAPDEGIEACVSDPSHPAWPACNVVKEFDSRGWAAGISADPNAPWLQATPLQLRGYLAELQRRWPTNKMYLAEFGFAEPFEGVREPQELYRLKEDVARSNYYMSYLGEVLLAIHEDKLPIAGVFAWAMLDNLEWTSGLSTRFGIQYVNFTSLERHYKRSAFALAEFFRAHL